MDKWTAYCDKCGKAFDPNDAVKIPYQEYPGASTSYEEVSPCCEAGFNDAPPENECPDVCPTCGGELESSTGMVGEEILICRKCQKIVWEDTEDAIRRVE